MIYIENMNSGRWREQEMLVGDEQSISRYNKIKNIQKKKPTKSHLSPVDGGLAFINS